MLSIVIRIHLTNNLRIYFKVKPKNFGRKIEFFRVEMCYSNTNTDFYLNYVMYLVNEETRKPEKLNFMQL